MKSMWTATYAYLRSGEVARTIEVNPDIMVDLDAQDRILGVEVLGGTDWEAGLTTLAMTGRLTIPKRGLGA